jgi:hypothetical protein
MWFEQAGPVGQPVIVKSEVFGFKSQQKRGFLGRL